MMRYLFETVVAFGVAIFAMSTAIYAQDNPYREDGWAKLPDGRKLGQTSAIGIDSGGNVWLFERCGANSCVGSNVAPIIKFDSSGKYVTSFGTGLFVFPHGMHVDKDGNVWVADGDGKDGRNNPGVKRGIRIGNVNDGKVKTLIPGLGANADTQSVAEGVAVDAMGNVYGAESNSMIIRKFVKK